MFEKIKVTFTIVACSSLFLPAAHAAGAPSNTVRGGLLANPNAVLGLAEYERKFGDHFSLGARVGYLDYEWEDSEEKETGSGNGAEFLFRFYPKGEGFRGFWLGAAVGFWQTTWEWTDIYGGYDSGTSTSANVNFNTGWKIPVGGDHFYIDPNITVGNFFALSTSSDTGAYDSELGFYAAGGVSFGFNF